MPKGNSANLARYVGRKTSTKQNKQIKHFCQFPKCNLYSEHIAVQGEFSGRPHVHLCTRHLFTFRNLPVNGQDKINWQTDRVRTIHGNNYSSYGTNRYV